MTEPVTIARLEAALETPVEPDETLRRYVRELARRLAREDHEAHVAPRNSSPEPDVPT
jgi:hypothetical protein